MIEITILLTAFFIGAMAGVLVFLRIGFGREERAGSMTRTLPPTRAAAAARRVAGLYVRLPDTTEGERERVDEWQ